MDRDRDLHEMADEGRAWMSDYIKRVDALDIVAYNNVNGEITLNRYDKIIDGIYAIPSADVVAVVRCKDCVYGTDRTEDFQDEDERWDVVNPIACMMYSSDGEPDFFPKDNYCGFGKRRDDD